MAGSDFNNMVRQLERLAGNLERVLPGQVGGQGAPAGPYSGSGTIKFTPADVAAINGVNQGLDQTDQHAQAAGRSLQGAAEHLQRFAVNQIQNLGFDLLRTGMRAVTDEAERFVTIPNALESFARATGDLDPATRSLSDLTQGLEDQRLTLEALAFTPAFEILKQRWAEAQGSADQSSQGLEDSATKVGDALARIANLVHFDSGRAQQNELQTGLQDFFGGIVGSLAETIGEAFDLSPVSDEVKASYQGLIVLAGEWNDSLAESRGEIEQIQDRLANLRTTAQGIRDSYDAQIQPLRDQLSTLNEQYRVQQQQRQLNELSRDIFEESLLAGDVSSPEGINALRNLPKDLARRDDMLASIAHQNEVQALQDKISDLTRKQADDLAANAASARAAQRELGTRQANVSAEQEVRSRDRQFPYFYSSPTAPPAPLPYAPDVGPDANFRTDVNPYSAGDYGAGTPGAGTMYSPDIAPNQVIPPMGLPGQETGMYGMPQTIVHEQHVIIHMRDPDTGQDWLVQEVEHNPQLAQAIGRGQMRWADNP